MYNPEKQIIEQETSLFESTPKLDGNLLAIDNKGEAQVIEIDENRKRSRCTKEFRIKPNKTNFSKRFLNNDNEFKFDDKNEIKQSINYKKLVHATSQPNFRNNPIANKTAGKPFQISRRFETQNPLFTSTLAPSQNIINQEDSPKMLYSKVQKPRFHLKGPMFDKRPIVTFRGTTPLELLPQQYKDLLSARDDQVRSSCPREIRGDPPNIDDSIILADARKTSNINSSMKKFKKRIVF